MKPNKDLCNALTLLVRMYKEVIIEKVVYLIDYLSKRAYFKVNCDAFYYF